MGEKDCVCWSGEECLAISRWEYAKGYNCKVCRFHKTAEEYLKQTGITYEEAMKEVYFYGRND